MWFARRYKIDSLLGRGGFGRVFRAWDNMQEQNVALKLFMPGCHPVFAVVEAAALTALQGPNILRVHNAHVHQDVPYIATEIAALGSANDQLKGTKGIRPDLARLWTRHLLAGLHVCHNHGLLHRDIKPHNLFLQSQDLAQLGDFGLVDRMDASGKTTAAGTRPYMPPEAFVLQEMTVRSDVYSAGLTLWALLTGENPYEHLPLADLAPAIIAGKRPRLRDLAPHVPAALARVAEEAASTDPNQRFRTASAMDAALAKLHLPQRLWEEVVPPTGVHRRWASISPSTLEVSVRQLPAKTYEIETIRPASSLHIKRWCLKVPRLKLLPTLRRLFADLDS